MLISHCKMQNHVADLVFRYQIFSATMPSVISNQQTAENCSNTPTTTTSSKKITEDITASSTPHPQTSLTLRPSHPLIATAAAATSTTSSKSGLVSTVTNPSAAPDPFLALLQQYSAGQYSICSSVYNQGYMSRRLLDQHGLHVHRTGLRYMYHATFLLQVTC